MDTKEKYQVWYDLRTKSDITLTENQVEIIDDVYKEREKESKQNLILYRLVNIFLAVLIMFVLSFNSKHQNKWYFFFVITSFFGVVNIFYFFVNWFDYYLFKKRNGIISKND